MDSHGWGVAIRRPPQTTRGSGHGDLRSFLRRGRETSAEPRGTGNSTRARAYFATTLRRPRRPCHDRELPVYRSLILFTGQRVERRVESGKLGTNERSTSNGQRPTFKEPGKGFRLREDHKESPAGGPYTFLRNEPNLFKQQNGI
jgi:hypothetical protein